MKRWKLYFGHPSQENDKNKSEGNKPGFNSNSLSFNDYEQMSEIRNLTRNGETFYPLTHVDAIVSNTGSGIDDVPTPDSDNLVKSDGVFDSIYDHLRGKLLERTQIQSDKFLHYNANTGKIYVDTAGDTRFQINIYLISDLPRDSKLDIIATTLYTNYYFAFYSSSSFTEQNYLSCSKERSGETFTEYEEEVNIPIDAQYLVVSSYLAMNERVIAYNSINSNIYDKVLTEQGNFILDYWGDDGNEIKNLPNGAFFYNTYTNGISYKIGDAGSIDSTFRYLTGFIKKGQQYVYKDHIYTSYDGQTLVNITANSLYASLKMKDSAKRLTPYLTESGKFVYYDTPTNECSVLTTTGSYCIEAYKVSAGDIINIKASTQWNNPYYAFFSSDIFTNDNFVSVSEIHPYDNTKVERLFDDVKVPEGANYVVINFLNELGFDREVSIDGTFVTQLYGGLSEDNTLFGKKWACIGDSLTENNERTTLHYFDYIAFQTGVRPLNYGYSGSGYAKYKDVGKAFYQRILDIDPTSDIITIFGSFNDLGAINDGLTIGSVDDNTTDTMAGCINKTIDNLYTIIPLARLGIVLPTPWHTTQPTNSGVAYEYVEIIKKICERRSIPCLDLWRHSNLRPWDASFRQIAYSKDPEGNGTHPDENGHSIIAPMFREFIKTLI